jgi:hypothetical protein
MNRVTTEGTCPYNKHAWAIHGGQNIGTTLQETTSATADQALKIN